MTRELGDRMVADPRFKLLTFTGSPSVGWRMKERAGKKKVVLELGGNAGVIVDKSADLDWAIKRCLVGAFAYAGQVCISVQRAFIHEDVWDEFMAPLRRGRAGAQGRRPARPDDRPRPDGRRERREPDRSAGSTRRSRLGGKVLLGGKADGTFFPPTILTDVPPTAQVCSNEAFAPLVVAFPFSDFDEAIAGVNDSMFGLQTGVFTNDLAGCVARVQRARGRRRHRQRRADVPHRPHAVRRRQGLRPRPRGAALRHRGHDRDPHHGARPARLTPQVRPRCPRSTAPDRTPLLAAGHASGTKVRLRLVPTSRGGPRRRAIQW